MVQKRRSFIASAFTLCFRICE